MAKECRERKFSERDLIERLKGATPGEPLDLKDVPLDEIGPASRGLSVDPERAPVPRDNHADLGPHVHVRQDWWGIQVDVDHTGMLALQKGGAAGALIAVGVNALAAGIIAGVIGIWSAFDQGKGVAFYVTWTGVHWFATL